MAEQQATRPQAASAPTHQAHENKDLGKAADTAKRPDANRAADLKKLETLQGEYDTTKAKVEKSAKSGKLDNEGLARKGELTREIDALKRKHDLP